MTDAGSDEKRRVASANVAMGTALVFVAVSALLSFAPDRSAASGDLRLRGALGPVSPLPAPVKPV